MQRKRCREKIFDYFYRAYNLTCLMECFPNSVDFFLMHVWKTASCLERGCPLKNKKKADWINLLSDFLPFERVGNAARLFA